MSPRNDYKKLLLEQAEKDKAKNLSINDIDINRCKNIKREMRINFKCNCGNVYNKNIRNCLENTGLFCKECTLKTRLDKMKATNMEKYGVENPFQNKEVQDKMKATNMEKYGVENPFQNKEVLDKMKATNMEKYGVENPMQNKEVQDKLKATNMEKYGVENPMHDKEVFEKSQKSLFKSLFKQKLYKFKSGEEDNCQGYEPLAIKELEELYDYTYEDYKNWNNLEFYYEINNKKHRYYPDIPFIRMNKIIEVKSNYTFYKELCKNLKKAECVIKQGFDFEFWIYDTKFNKFIFDNKTIELKQELHKELLQKKI